MSLEDFDWTVIGTDPSTGRIVWAVECGVCREKTRTQGAELLSRDDQVALLRKVAEQHVCKGA